MNKSLEEIKALRAENAALRNALGPAVDFILQVRPALWSRQGEASDLIKRGLDAMNGTSPLTQQDPL